MGGGLKSKRLARGGTGFQSLMTTRLGYWKHVVPRTTVDNGPSEIPFSDNARPNDNHECHDEVASIGGKRNPRESEWRRSSLDINHCDRSDVASDQTLTSMLNRRCEKLPVNYRDSLLSADGRRCFEIDLLIGSPLSDIVRERFKIFSRRIFEIFESLWNSELLDFPWYQCKI